MTQCFVGRGRVKNYNLVRSTLCSDNFVRKIKEVRKTAAKVGRFLLSFPHAFVRLEWLHVVIAVRKQDISLRRFTCVRLERSGTTGGYRPQYDSRVSSSSSSSVQHSLISSVVVLI